MRDAGGEGKLKLPSVYLHSGPTPRGLEPPSAARTVGAMAVPRSRRASRDVLLILGRHRSGWKRVGDAWAGEEAVEASLLRRWLAWSELPTMRRKLWTPLVQPRHLLTIRQCGTGEEEKLDPLSHIRKSLESMVSGSLHVHQRLTGSMFKTSKCPTFECRKRHCKMEGRRRNSRNALLKLLLQKQRRKGAWRKSSKLHTAVTTARGCPFRCSTCIPMSISWVPP